MAEAIELPFWDGRWGGFKVICFKWGTDAPWEGANIWEKWGGAL